MCSYIPQNYRDDVKQDIYLKLLIDLNGRSCFTDEENYFFCISKIPYYRKIYFKKYLNPKSIPLDNIENFGKMDENEYKIEFDLDKVWPLLTQKQKKLLAYLLKNGIDSTYEEVKDEMGYKNASMGMWSIRLLLQKIRRIMENNDEGAYSHENRYLRYGKKPKIEQ